MSDAEDALKWQESHKFCSRLAMDALRELKIKKKDVDAIRFGRHDSHYGVHFPISSGFGSHGFMGSYQGCCKWDAIFRACKAVQNE